MSNQRTKPTFRPTVEHLELRVTPAITAKYFAATETLEVTGDSMDNDILLTSAVNGNILINGGAVSIQNGPATLTNTKIILVYGLGGDDNIQLHTLTAWTGADKRTELYGGGNADIINGSWVFDKIEGGGGQDVLEGGEGNDSIQGENGTDSIFGEGGNDTIQGNDDADSIDGGSGQDNLNGGDGSDTIHGGSENDILDGGLGGDVDWMYGDDDHDNLNGQGGNDRLYGGWGIDILIGSGGSDKIYNNDETQADGASDTIYGGVAPSGPDGESDEVWFEVGTDIFPDRDDVGADKDVVHNQ